MSTTLRVALGQVNTCVGDLHGNAELVRAAAREAVAAAADVLVLPEMTLTGYPPEDLVLRRSFARASQAAVEQLARDLADDGCADLLVAVGFLDGADDDADAGLSAPGQVRRTWARNAVALVAGGRVVERSAKHHLPTYGVFDEDRYFRAGTRLPVLRLHGVDVTVAVCEDLWVDRGPLEAAREAGAGLVCVLNGSPFERGKASAREDLACRRAREVGAPLVYVNQVGGQDELVFDGGSFAVDGSGAVVARAAQNASELLLVDLACAPASSERVGDVRVGDDGSGDPPVISVVRADVPSPGRGEAADRPPLAPRVAEPAGDLASLWGALVVATRDYVRKNGFSSVVLGLSGGIDSAVVATLATDALGADQVHTVALPSVWSTDHSLSDAADLAERQGTRHSVVEIAPAVDAVTRSLAASGGLEGLAAENLQARVRGLTLMALSNEHGHLVLTTGNKSELAVGYSTLYGDSAGAFAPIKDVLKTDVWALARWRNADAESRGEQPPVPPASIEKEPSAELRADQRDTDSLPPYEVLDPLLSDYVDRDLGRDGLLGAGHAPDLVERVLRLVDLAEYKRRQYPPGPKTSLKAFGRDRRLPITSRWREPVAGVVPDLRTADAGPAGEPAADPR